MMKDFIKINFLILILAKCYIPDYADLTQLYYTCLCIWASTTLAISFYY